MIPLRWRGQTRSIGFVHHGDRLVSDSDELCGFVPMLGPDQAGQRSVPLDGDGLVTMTFDADQDIDPATLHNILYTTPHRVWSGQMIGNRKPMDGIAVRLAATEPGTCRLASDDAAVQAGLRDPDMMLARYPALAERGSLAHLNLRRVSHRQSCWELGAVGFGPQGADLADRMCQQIRASVES